MRDTFFTMDLPEVLGSIDKEDVEYGNKELFHWKVIEKKTKEVMGKGICFKVETAIKRIVETARSVHAPPS